MSQTLRNSRARFSKLYHRNSSDPNVVRTRVTLGGSVNSVVGTSGTTFTYADLQGSADFANFATLYQTYRVVGMEFEVFDQVPTAVNPITVGTVHTAGTAPTASGSLVQDLPDARNIQPYGGSTYFYWFPNNPAEKLYLDANTNTLNYGGLVVVTIGGAAQTGKVRVLARYVVEFKDRK